MVIAPLAVVGVSNYITQNILYIVLAICIALPYKVQRWTTLAAANDVTNTVSQWLLIGRVEDHRQRILFQNESIIDVLFFLQQLIL